MPRLSAPVAVVASAAMIASIGAGSYAAGTLITSKQIKDGTIQVKDINKKAVASLRGKTGPAGPAGPTGAAGAAGAAGPAGPRGLSAWDQVPSGTTVTGTWYVDGHASGAGQDFGTSFSLPARASAALVFGSNASFKPNAAVGSGVQGDAACAGTPGTPTAPAGKLCVYIQGAVQASVFGTGATVPQTPNAFGIRVASTAAGDVYASGTWAYTAP